MVKHRRVLLMVKETNESSLLNFKNNIFNLAYLHEINTDCTMWMRNVLLLLLLAWEIWFCSVCVYNWLNSLLFTHQWNVRLSVCCYCCLIVITRFLFYAVLFVWGVLLCAVIIRRCCYREHATLIRLLCVSFAMYGKNRVYSVQFMWNMPSFIFLLQTACLLRLLFCSF